MIPDVVRRLRGRAIHVVGLSGTEGSAVVEFLLRCGLTNITAHDLQTRETFPEAFRRTHEWLAPAEREAALARLLAAPIALRFRDRYLEGMDRADLIYTTQAWFRYPENAPVRQAREAGVPLSSMTALFFETVPCPILGVTGTNGKFTVVHLAAAMLEESGRRVFVSGNDRTHVPILYRLHEVTPDSILVLEISNRQLVGLPYSPQIAVITNLAPHHLDDHGSFEAYVETKRGILAHQRAHDRAILNGDDPTTCALARGAPARTLLWSRLRTLDEGGCVVDGQIVLRLDGRDEQVGPADLPVPGAHALENALASALAARVAGASPAAIGTVLRRFRGLPYRLRLVAEIEGVRYYEDSLATNPAAAAAAVLAFDRPLVLLAGGQRPGATARDFRPVADALRRRPPRAVVVFGAMGPRIEEAISETGGDVRVVRCETLDEAVAAAHALARPGDVVSLSPACESFDQFRDYRHRAERFCELVAVLQRGAAPGAGEPRAASRMTLASETPRGHRVDEPWT
ncbi:MAG TPA: UDP-N-acetylmuramoyl-L-alanine--D-glutamate ligase [bacterium]|nr:UDP-N-acetylmuramoyl-L-alanine--D-glutamate ligase [bacterium]